MELQELGTHEQRGTAWRDVAEAQDAAPEPYACGELEIALEPTTERLIAARGAAPWKTLRAARLGANDGFPTLVESKTERLRRNWSGVKLARKSWHQTLSTKAFPRSPRQRPVAPSLGRKVASLQGAGMVKRSLIAMGLAALLAVAVVAQQSPAPKDNQPTSPLSTTKDKASYALGMNLGTQLHRAGVDIDPAIFAQGMSDAMSGKTPAMTQEEAQKDVTDLRNEQMAKQKQMQAELAQKNAKEEQAFLAENKNKPGVTTLPDGLQYKILKQGDGPKPAVDDTVVCNYEGTLINGTVFDSSYKRGEPVTFPVKEVIKGWSEALQLMPVGSKWQLFVPSALAYGEQGRPGIEPNAMLIFEVELISINNKAS